MDNFKANEGRKRKTSDRDESFFCAIADSRSDVKISAPEKSPRPPAKKFPAEFAEKKSRDLADRTKNKIWPRDASEKFPERPAADFVTKNFSREKIRSKNTAANPDGDGDDEKFFKKLSRQNFERTLVIAASTLECSTWNSLNEIFKKLHVIPCAAKILGGYLSMKKFLRATIFDEKFAQKSHLNFPPQKIVRRDLR